MCLGLSRGGVSLGRVKIRVFPCAIAIGLALSSRPALATDCEPASQVSTCFDADNLWLSAGPSRFVSIAPGEIAPKQATAFAASLGYISRPIVLSAPSPDPDGREIRVVNDALNLTTAWAYAPTSSFEVTFAAPLTLHQTGAGAEGYTSQNGPPLARTAVHDPRIGAGLSLPVPESFARTSHFAAKARLELAIPFGDEADFAGERGPSGSATVAASFHHGILFGGAEVGLRYRPATRFATARLGTSLFSAVGLGVDILTDDFLSLGAEAWMLPVLVSQPGRTSSSTEVRDGLLVPAEWLATFRSAPTSDKGFSVQLGGGTGIPLSSETRTEAGQTASDQFSGVTTPRFRLVFVVRYTPEAAPAIKTPARGRK